MPSKLSQVADEALFGGGELGETRKEVWAGIFVKRKYAVAARPALSPGVASNNERGRQPKRKWPAYCRRRHEGAARNRRRYKVKHCRPRGLVMSGSRRTARVCLGFARGANTRRVPTAASATMQSSRRMWAAGSYPPGWACATKRANPGAAGRLIHAIARYARWRRPARTSSPVRSGCQSASMPCRRSRSTHRLAGSRHKCRW
jgi:hypothetical protein